MYRFLRDGVYARMLECHAFDRHGRWDYDWPRLARRMSEDGAYKALVHCVRQNIPGDARYIPSSHVSYNTTMHTFVDGDDRRGDAPGHHVGGNFGFLVAVANTSVSCSYIADASTTGTGRRCALRGERYRDAYLRHLRALCARKVQRASMHLERCCHGSVREMLAHQRAIRVRTAADNDCVRGHAAAMNQVQIAFSVSKIRALFVRNNYPGFSRHWLDVLPRAFAEATGRSAPRMVVF